MDSSIVKKNQYEQFARKMFSPALHDSAPYLAIRLSCKDHESMDNRQLIVNVYIKYLEFDSALKEPR